MNTNQKEIKSDNDFDCHLKITKFSKKSLMQKHSINDKLQSLYRL